MGRTKKKEVEIVLTKENLSYQPLALAVSGYEASVLQQNVIISILNKMKKAIKRLRSNNFSPNPRQLSIFTMDEMKSNIIRDGDLAFDIHMNELVSEAKHYQMAFNALYSMGDVKVWMPVVDDKGNKKMARTELFYTLRDDMEAEKDKRGNLIYKYKLRHPVVTVVIRKEIAQFIFTSDKRINDFIEDTAKMITLKFPKRIYMYLSNFKYWDTHKVDYWRFRHDIGFNDEDAPIDAETKERIVSYPYYCDFVKRVLAPAEKILKEMSDANLCDFYFDVEPIYKGSKRARNPDELLFTFHISDLGKAIKGEKSLIKKEIELEELLQKELEQEKSQIAMFLRRLTDDNRGALLVKVQQLIKDKKKVHKVPIKDVKSWANAALTNFFDDWEDKRKQRVVKAEKVKPTEEIKELPKLSDEDKNKWNKFLNEVKGKISGREYKTWFAVIRPLNVENSMLVIEIPNKFFYEYLEDHYVDIMKNALATSFGPNFKLMYKMIDM